MLTILFLLSRQDLLYKIAIILSKAATYYFIMKIPSKKELQHITLNHSSDSEFKDFMKLYKDYTKELCWFLVNNASLSSDNQVKPRKNLYKNGC